jgi:hypothetical protein
MKSRNSMDAHSLIPQLIGIRNVLGVLIEQLLPPGKYTGSTLNEAILDVVANHPDGIDVPEIQRQIVAGGYESRSPYLRGIVNSTCLKCAARGEIQMERQGTRKIFKPIMKRRE